ncbi:hypothetical protein HO133_011087 [Letharia lupina]|uniref:Uncharacterized protein n=1 Tax=Letharia lupina TaxID=560253 RepID=A0A8H6FDN3_9LECA|nr:uncharacterized protein HO133_011087 [Letharia lupina]KAF6224510.1 hypothetical protein HO133_011087 [Letharia lupina]
MDLAFLTRLIGLALVALPVAYAYPSSLSSFISAPLSQPLSQATVTIAGQVFIVDPADIILDRTTIEPGSAGISINDQIVSADAAHDLFVDGTEILADPTGSNSAENIANNKTAKFSSNATFSGSVPASSVTAAAAGYDILGGEIAHIAVQVASTHATYRAGVPISTSVSASTSMAATPSGGSAPLGPVVIPSASSAMTNSSLSKASTAGLAPNVQENVSQTQSRSTGSDSMSASTPKINLIPTGSSIHSNSSSGLYVVAGASKISSSASSDRQSMHTTGTPSPSAILVPGGQPNTITTGPTLAIPTISLNPTGSVASSQVMLLVGAIFSITEEAKTLSAIIKDNGPKVSLVSKIKGIDDRILNELEDMHPPGPPPSNAAGPDFCAANSWIANVQIDDAVTNAPPYPTKDFKFAIPAGILEPAPLPCTWQPSPGNSQPGSMRCNPGEEIVLCTIPVTTAITCKQDNPDRIEPLAQCVFWQ